MRNDPQQILRDIGRRVAELRKAQDLTQAQLAELARVSVRYLQSVESGGQNLTIESLAALADVLGARLRELLKVPRTRKVRTGRPPKSRRSTT